MSGAKNTMTRVYILLPFVVLLFATILPMSAAQTQSPTAIVVIDENGVARVYMNTSVVEGVSNIVLPIKPVDVSIEISSDTNIEWLTLNNSLYIVSPKNTTVSISYIANVTIADGIFQLDVLQPVTIRLATAPNILLLSIPNETVFGEVTDSNIVMEFKGPATIMYTIISSSTQTKTSVITPTTIKQTAPVATTQSTVATKTTSTTQLTSATQTSSTTQIIQINTSTTAGTYTATVPTTTKGAPLISTPPAIGIAVAMLIIVIVVVILLIKRK